MMDSFEIIGKQVIYNGVWYNFDKLPENVVFDGGIDLTFKSLSTLPNMSTWVIKNNFLCFGNRLRSLKGCPKEICGNFYCSINDLTSLKHCPKKIGGDFWYSCNEIEIIDEWPETIGGNLSYNNNPIKSIKEGVVPLKYLIKFYKEGIGNSKELLMKEFGCNNTEELSAYLLMMGEI